MVRTTSDPQNDCRQTLDDGHRRYHVLFSTAEERRRFVDHAPPQPTVDMHLRALSAVPSDGAGLKAPSSDGSDIYLTPRGGPASEGGPMTEISRNVRESADTRALVPPEPVRACI